MASGARELLIQGGKFWLFLSNLKCVSCVPPHCCPKASRAKCEKTFKLSTLDNKSASAQVYHHQSTAVEWRKSQPQWSLWQTCCLLFIASTQNFMLVLYLHYILWIVYLYNSLAIVLLFKWGFSCRLQCRVCICCHCDTSWFQQSIRGISILLYLLPVIRTVLHCSKGSLIWSDNRSG